MNQKKIILCVLAMLLTLTAVLAMIHLTSRDAVPEDAVAVVYSGKRVYLEKSALEKERVAGTLVNGKGKEIPVDALGTSLSDVLTACGIDPEQVSAVRVTAQDAFSAEVTGEELRQPGKAFLIGSENTVTLVVFGDSNSKRNVRQVALIEAMP